MYTIYAGNEILHNPMLADSGRLVISPVLTEALNTHGSLSFGVAPTNPLYDSLELRKTKIKVSSDTDGNRAWFGRVTEIESGWDNTVTVYCEGELGCLNDSIYRPFGFTGTPLALFSDLVSTYNDSMTGGYRFYVGNVSVTDPNNTIVRSSKYAESVWKAMDSKLIGSSLGGYIMPRYDQATDKHYIDYLALNENDRYARTSTQIIQFGKNLLDFVRHGDAVDVITVLIPYGAQYNIDDPRYQSDPPVNGQWSGNALTIVDANNGNDYIEDSNGISMWGRIVGTKTWPDVTVASNLLSNARSWLAEQVYKAITLEIQAVDLSFLHADIEQIQVGDYVRVQSKPHNLNALMLCTSKTTHLAELEKSSIVLGAGQKTITDLQSQSKSKEDLN